jgi:two-component system CheB/CheR fusion protein
MNRTNSTGLVHPKFVVGIGGSAGGLKAYMALLDALPPDTGMAFVVIAHMKPDGISLLPELLAHRTGMPVTGAVDGMPIEANHVYVITPNTDLLVDENEFKVHSPRTMRGGRHNQVDRFLISLADTMAARGIGIILSGGDGDGTAGCEHIKAMGGKTFAQDLSADVDSMPLHAAASGCVDFVLAPEAIAKKLTEISAQTT